MYKVKAVNFELKDVDEKQGILVCHPSVYGVIDSDGDMVMPGAFDKTIQEWGPDSPKPRIKHLYQHDRNQIIGIPVSMMDAEKFLRVESKFGKDQFSQDKMQQHIDGLISEMSYGYDVIKSEPATMKDGKPYTKLLELKMWEYSSVTWGANSLTTAFAGAKGDKKSVLDELNERMNKFIKALRNPKYTDETLWGFELEIKQIQTIINEILLKPEPPNGTPEPEQSTLIKELSQILFT